MFIESGRTEQVEAFNEVISGIDKVMHLPENYATSLDVRSTNKFVEDRKLTDPAVYLHPNVTIRNGGAVLGFVNNPTFEEGKTSSVNGVFFGRLDVLDYDGRLTPVTVAVKPRYSAGSLAAHEYGAHNFINGRNGLTTYEPLGLIVGRDGEGRTTTYFVTVFRPNVVTFDNLSWDIGAEDMLTKYEDSARVRETSYNLARAALYLSGMHELGMKHGDAQAKNVAIETVYQSSTRLVDLENAALYYDQDNWLISSYDIASLFGNDVNTFLRSVRRMGFLAIDEPEKGFEAVKRYFIKPYLSRFSHPSSRLHHLANGRFENKSSPQQTIDSIIAHIKDSWLSE